MARQTVISPEAWEEIDEAFDWYEQQEAGLGDRFFLFLKRSIELARNQPDLYPLRFDQVRRIMVSRFPYAVYYEHDNHAIYVLSVFHESRNPARLHPLRKF